MWCHTLLNVISVICVLGTTVIANIWGVCHDETVFEDAHKFKADRFIDDDGKFQKPGRRQFMPFSIGMCYWADRSLCIGNTIPRWTPKIPVRSMLYGFYGIKRNHSFRGCKSLFGIMLRFPKISIYTNQPFFRKGQTLAAESPFTYIYSYVPYVYRLVVLLKWGKLGPSNNNF